MTCESCQPRCRKCGNYGRYIDRDPIDDFYQCEACLAEMWVNKKTGEVHYEY